MGVDREVSVREFLADFECQRLDSSEVARLLSHMAPDAKYHVSAWEPPFVGHDAIRAELLQQGEVVTDVRVEILSIASAGQTVFTERLDSMTMGREVSRVPYRGSVRGRRGRQDHCLARLLRYEGDGSACRS